ncbi:MAG: hypothetical protein ABI812_03160 [Betaproteobacteria bacterium]
MRHTYELRAAAPHGSACFAADLRRSLRTLALGAAVAVFASGCALQDTRYDYSRNALPFADYDESILDWNFPTTTSQGLLEPPRRIQPWRPAVGVPWANGNPMPWSYQAPASEVLSEPSAAPHDPALACGDDCATTPLAPPAADAGVVAGVRKQLESRGTR